MRLDRHSFISILDVVMINVIICILLLLLFITEARFHELVDFIIMKKL